MTDFMEIYKERDAAYTDAVVNDNWDAVRKYAKKYCIPIPRKRNVMKAGIYKATQYCTNIPDDVKDIAMVKCLALGFTPYIKPIEKGDTQ